MQTPKLPHDEAQRLQALRALNLLDTPAEERFDRLTRLAKAFFNVPIALVSLVDEHRQWFKSRQGVDVCQTGRDISFCGHAILGEDIFTVRDAREDPRFADNPLVTNAPNIRFYAGAPLHSSEGYRLGTLCLIDSQPRSLSEQEREVLRELADCVERELNLLVEDQLKAQLAQSEARSEAVLASSRRMTEVIANAQSQFIREQDRRRAFDGLLSDILALTDSEYGFIGEVLYQPDGKPYLKTYAITNIAWNDETRAFYEKHAPRGMEFTNLNTLFGVPLTSGEPVIANDPYHDPRRGGLPDGHPALNAFLGLPVYHDDTPVAVLGIANRPEGYNQQVIDFLHPLMITLGQLVEAARVKREQQEGERRLAAIIEATHIGTWEWNVQTGETIFNDRWADIIGYSLDELTPISIDTWMKFAHPDDLSALEQALQGHFAGELDYYDVQCRMRHKRGHWVWVQDRGQVVSWSSDGKPEWMYGTHADITAQKQAELALQQSEQQYRSLVDNIPGVTYRCLHDAHWTVLYMSQAIDPITGYPVTDFVDNAVRSYASIIHREDTEMVERVIVAAVEAGESWEVTYRVVHREGSIHWVQERGRAIHDRYGHVAYLDGFILDVTESRYAKEAMEASEARLRGLFELSPIGIALNDYETGAFVDLNEALLRPTGYSREEFVQLSYWDITPKEYEAQEMAQLESLDKTGRFGPFEKEYIHKDGSRYPVLLNGMVVRDNSGRKLIWSMIEDISERKRIERMKNEFISTVSHELRTPLTSINGALGLTAGGALGELSAQARAMIEIAYKNSQRLGYLINDLLDMEKLVAGKMRFDLHVQPLQALLEQAIQDNRAYADQFKVRLRLSHGAGGAQVKVDAQRLQQVLANLLSNAAKFSPEGGEVSVYTRSADGWIQVSVRDQGPGIAEEFREYVFDKFAQADGSDTRQKGGSGLGLAITRELMERMGGSVGFDSVPGEGATFWFALPMVTKGKQG